jgi:ribosome-binding factor A
MNHRILRVKELIRREVGNILERNFSFKDCLVTIHDVDMTPDLKQCFIYVGILGKGESPEVIIQRLNEGRGLIQRQLFKRVVLKNSPTLIFKHTDSVERGVRVLNIIENLPEPAAPAEEPHEELEDWDEEEDEQDPKK